MSEEKKREETPISSNRLDEETKDPLRSGELMFAEIFKAESKAHEGISIDNSELSTEKVKMELDL